jgi:nucleoside-diphosphate-sugar epimerase
MNVLITGADGFIGTALSNKYKHTDLVEFTRSKYGDIANIDFAKLPIQDFHVIYHLASTVHNYHILDNPYLDINTNCIGTIKLLDNIKQYCPNAKLVFVSTFFVNSGQPLGLYGASKLFAEHACRIYGKVFNLNVSIARLCNVYGCGESTSNNKKNAFMRLLYRLYTNQSIEVYNENILRDLVYIDDVVNALETIAARGENQFIYTVGTGQKYLFKSLIEQIKKYLNSTSEIIYVDVPQFHKCVGMTDLNYEINSLISLGWIPKTYIFDGIDKVINNHKDFVL